MLRQTFTTLQLQASFQGLHEIGEEVGRWVADSEIRDGLLTLFCRHSSASLLIQENAAPAARRDLEDYFARIAPEDSSAYSHNDEGADDMPAHLRAALTQTQLSVPVQGSRTMLGPWQGIYLFEHRREPPPRQILLHLIGE
jgi:secondary thiamine-phosphate synthase enzyme